jgi:hypothetical protein
MECGLRGEPVEELDMKIKKKTGPHEFMFWMNLRSKAPRVHKLLMRRAMLIEQTTFEPGKIDTIIKKVHRIDIELTRHTKSLERAGFELEYQNLSRGG